MVRAQPDWQPINALDENYRLRCSHQPLDQRQRQHQDGQHQRALDAQRQFRGFGKIAGAHRTHSAAAGHGTQSVPSTFCSQLAMA